MYAKIQKFIRLFAKGMIYGAAVNAQGGGIYVQGTLS